MNPTRICVFAGSKPGARAEYRNAAEALGREIADRNCGLVYGGGCVGLMGVLADAALSQGGHVTGVIPAAIFSKEVEHRGVSDLRVVSSMHERKSLMSELSDGFVALPGGLGTLEELFEVLTWAQLGIHTKPCGVLNVDGYYDGLLSFLDHAVAESLVGGIDRSLLIVEEQPAALLEQFAAYQAPPIEKWLDRRQT